jgi:hypothetical protein
MNNDGLSELFAQYDIGKETRADFLKRLNAARDEWWIEQIDAMFEGNKPYYCFNEEFPPCKKCNAVASNLCPFYKWQSLKLSLQSSAALTNLMGKFPDLPDVAEAGQ